MVPLLLRALCKLLPTLKDGLMNWIFSVVHELWLYNHQQNFLHTLRDLCSQMLEKFIYIRVQIYLHWKEVVT